jgi:hypothetical protein
MEEKTNGYKIYGEKPLVRPSRGWEYIEMSLEKTRYSSGIIWLRTAQQADYCYYYCCCCCRRSQ